MQRYKIALIVTTIMIIFVPFAYIGYVELFVIPNMLVSKFGQMSILVHVLGVLFIAVVWGEIRAWLTKKNLFAVQKDLAMPMVDKFEKSTETLMNVIENVTNGKWSTDARTMTGLIDTGARLGFAVGKVTQQVELDRNLLEKSIGAMALPAPKEVTGQSVDVVEEMKSYMDNLDGRKARLGD